MVPPRYRWSKIQKSPKKELLYSGQIPLRSKSITLLAPIYRVAICVVNLHQRYFCTSMGTQNVLLLPTTKCKRLQITVMLACSVLSTLAIACTIIMAQPRLTKLQKTQSTYINSSFTTWESVKMISLFLDAQWDLDPPASLQERTTLEPYAWCQRTPLLSASLLIKSVGCASS